MLSMFFFFIRTNHIGTQGSGRQRFKTCREHGKAFVMVFSPFSLFMIIGNKKIVKTC